MLPFMKTLAVPSSLLLLLLAPLLGCAHDEHADLPIVRKLQIDGAKEVNAEEIKKKILTSQQSWIPFQRKQHFDKNVWRTDLDRIERYYREQGYYQAKVVENQITPDGKDGVGLTVKVEEGRATGISKLEIKGLDGLPEAHRKQLLKDIPLKAGDIFVEDKWKGLKDELSDHLLRLGYVDATVEGNAQVDLETQRAEIALQVEPGLRYKFGAITVTTLRNARVETWRVAEQAEEAIVGEPWYSEAARAEAQARVFNMGVFGAAKVTLRDPDPKTGTVPLDIDVQEAAFHTERYGFGAGIEQQRNDFHLIGEYTHRDFLGRLRRLDLRLRAGWAFLPSAYAVIRNAENERLQNGPVARATAELTQPRLFSPNFSLNNRLEVERTIEPAYSYYGGRERIGVTWHPWTYFTITPSYNIEFYKLQFGEAELQGSVPSVLFGCTGNCAVVLSYLEQRIELDRRDDRQEPKSGYLAGLSLQEGGGPLGGSFNYLRVVPEIRGYVSTLERSLTFSAKLRVGTLIPTSGPDSASPIVARFFSGGDQMRGFSTRRLSPQALVKKNLIPGSPAPEFNSEPVPIGGNGLFESQFEVRYDLIGNLVVAAFTDFGFVTAERVQFNSSYFGNNLLIAVGGGVRYRTPVGPIRLDLAYRPDLGLPLQLNSFPGSDPALTYAPGGGCFGFGNSSPSRAGYPEGNCSIHLSIGEAF